MYKQRLLKLDLFSLSFFLEYLNLLFLFRCIKGETLRDISDTIQFSRSSTRRGSTERYIRLISARTTTHHDSYFVRVCPLRNSLLLEMRCSERTSLFKSRLKALFAFRLTPFALRLNYPSPKICSQHSTVPSTSAPARIPRSLSK